MDILKSSDVLLCDANVLIDFIDSNAMHVFKKLSQLHTIHVPIPVLNEVKNSMGIDLQEYGLLEFEPDFDMVAQAAAMIGKCSPQDYLCLLICKKNNWRCLTNDKALRNQCISNKIKPIWGLQLLIYLSQHKILSKKEGIAICNKIALSNKHITKDIIEDFLNKINVFTTS